jgi:hypothetical protein
VNGVSNPYSGAIKKHEKKASKRSRDTSEDIETWRRVWKEAGVIRFAEEVLICPPDVPVNPKTGEQPVYVLLSDDQRQFLLDITTGKVSRFILSAGRGAGKTFIIAVYVAWRITCFNDFSMTVMGGSNEQSLKIKEYIDFWRDRVQEMLYCLERSVSGGNQSARVESRWNSYARFPACSETSSRGSHVTQVIIDEVCVGEGKSKGGAKAVRSARYQLTASADSLLGYTSTAQYILGTFFHTVTHAKELGFTAYRWSIARHTSEMWYFGGTKNPNWQYIDEVLTKDKDPKHWVSNVWWVMDGDIKDFRKNTTNDEFLVEILGGMSRGSGLAFSRDDLKFVICDGTNWTENCIECETCEPYTDKCPMMKKLELTKSMISDRKMGFDFGEVSPNAMTVVGKRNNMVFVLYSDERTGASSEEVLQWINDKAKEYKLYDIFADPEERAMRQAIENMDYSTPNVWAATGGGSIKRQYVNNVKRHVEKHILIIPMAFEYLVESVRELSYDEDGGIRKNNDHSYDSLMFSMIDYDVDDDSGTGFYGTVHNRGTAKIWT